jgi:GNAT acetyltransferase-like protein
MSAPTRTGPAGRGETLRVEWLRGWDDRLDAVLRVLPEPRGCPHSLMRLLIQNERPEPKLVAVVSAPSSEPVALVPLREIGDTAELVTNWLVTGPPFPAAPGWHLSAIRALNREVLVAWWPCGEDSFAHSPAQDLMVTPTRRVDLTADFEAYWRKTGLHKTVRLVRNRSAALRLEVDVPGTGEWVIRCWERRWRQEAAPELPSLHDRLVVAEHLEMLGRHHTFTLHGDDGPVGGLTALVCEGGLVAHHSFRRREYDRLGVGDRLFDILFHWGSEQGYEFVDIGGTDYGDYKRRWAPEGGWKASFRIAPRPTFARRVARTTGRLLQRAAAL